MSQQYPYHGSAHPSQRMHRPDGSDHSPPNNMSTAQYLTAPGDRSYQPYPPGSYYGGHSPAGPSHLQHLNPVPGHFYPPPLSPINEANAERQRPPPLSLNLPPTPFTNPNAPLGYGSMHPGHAQNSMGPLSHTPPYQTPIGMPLNSGSTGTNHGMTEYFPPFGTSPVQPQSLPFVSPTWSSAQPANPPGKPSSSKNKETGASGAKTSRQQFTACGACRHRRVKCDLKDRQEHAERLAMEEEGQAGPGPHRNSSSAAARRKKVTCTNCQERGTNCVDEYAPLKAAKQLRRGKRISEIEMLYGRSATHAAVVNNPDEATSDSSRSPSKGKEREEVVIPDLTKEFFESAFFTRFQVQRPIIDPAEFVQRYLAYNPPTAAAMGQEGAVLCQVLYAWAVSYGVNEHGQLDIAEGGEVPASPIDLYNPSDAEIKRESDRVRRKGKMMGILEVILRRIDECGIMRKPSWDGVRALLLILPLTEGISTPVERLSMYESAVSQVFTLCSFIGLGYDGNPSGSSGANGGSDQTGAQDFHAVRIRIYWYTFVHEGITTGLKGGRLHLDDEDLETIQDSIANRSLVHNSTTFRAAAKFATAPINLALACRLINKALTGPAAKRRQHVNGDAVKTAWEALENCWEEFDALKQSSPLGPYSDADAVVRFADGWKIFLFEAQNVIRKSLDDRLQKLRTLAGAPAAYIIDPQTDPSQESINVEHLLDIAKSKCEVKTRQILEIVRQHVGTRFFEWDASLVRDGTFYAAMWCAQTGGSDANIAVCIQALNELRWAHAKAWDRSAELRRQWSHSRSTVQTTSTIHGWEPAPVAEAPYGFQHGPILDGVTVIRDINDPSLSGSGSPYTSPGIISPTYDPSTGAPNGVLGYGAHGMPAPLPPDQKWFGGSYISNNHQPGLGLQPGAMLSHQSVSPQPPIGSLSLQSNGDHQYVQGQVRGGHYVFQPDGSQVYVPFM